MTRSRQVIIAILTLATILPLLVLLPIPTLGEVGSVAILFYLMFVCPSAGALDMICWAVGGATADVNEPGNVEDEKFFRSFCLFAGALTLPALSAGLSFWLNHGFVYHQR